MNKYFLLLVALAALVVSGCHHDDEEYAPPLDMFCFTAMEDGLEVSTKFFDKTRTHYNPSLLFSLNGTDWTPFVVGETAVILPHAGDRMYMKANETNTAFCHEADSGAEYLYNAISFQFTKQVKVSGNIMYLLDGKHPDKAQMGELAFACLFMNDSLLMDASELQLSAAHLTPLCYTEMFEGTSITKAPALPATETTLSCYESMFLGCKYLTEAPQLPATKMAYRCYSSMFAYCERLTTAPELPATQLDSICYRGMFEGCTALTHAPQLPAKQVVYYCYYAMFMGCTALTEGPDLPAETLAESCYRGMFRGCKSLTKLTCMATDISAENCVKGWLSNITTQGTLHAASGSNWEDKIPTTWTVEY